MFSFLTGLGTVEQHHLWAECVLARHAATSRMVMEYLGVREHVTKRVDSLPDEKAECLRDDNVAYLPGDNDCKLNTCVLTMILAQNAAKWKNCRG